MSGRTDRRLRMVAMLLVFTVFGTAATLRLGYWQVVAAPELVAQAEARIPKPRSPQPLRAEIVDRDGLTLAQTASLDRLEAHPNLVPDARRAEIVDRLVEILGQDSERVREAFTETLSTDEKWALLEPRLTAEQSAVIRVAMDDGDLPGISLQPVQVRVYPRKGGEAGTSLANHLLGFVDAGGRGMYGVERVYDEVLSGQVAGPVDMASVAGLSGTGTSGAPPTLRLTINARLQRQLERELAHARIANRAKRVSAIVMDPYTGAILASAAVPGYDANRFRDVASTSMSRLRDPVVSDVYEPGSVLKIFTVTAALHQGVVTPQTRVNDGYKIQFYGHKVRNADHKSQGSLRVKDAIALSRNVATARIAAKLASDTQRAARRLYDMWQRVGLVGPTGIDVASEAEGLAADPAKQPWAAVDLANRAFGQGVAVTLLQLATGVSTIVNGGFGVQPHVVDGSDAAAVPRTRVLEAKVARQARDILEHVTGSVSWYAQGSLIPGYMIGGKTGTAQIWDTRTNDWKPKVFNHSFIGYVGGDRPEAVIAVRIEEARTKIDGQGLIDLKIESYELYRMIARGAIEHLGIKRSKDKQAGLPILGTDAARKLTPDRAARARLERATSTSDEGGAERTKKARQKKQAKPKQQGEARESNGRPRRGDADGVGETQAPGAVDA